MPIDFDAYLEQLARSDEADAYLELDRDKELEYLRYAAFRFRHTARCLPASGGPRRILDIGTTPFTLYLKASRPDDEVTTLDRTTLLADRCRAAGVAHATCDLDVDPFPFPDEAFDVVVFTEVLEHVFRPPSEVLGEVRRILAPGGMLVLSVPNIAYVLNRVRLLLGRTPLEDPDQQMNKSWVHGHGHLHEYTLRELERVVPRAGLRIESRHFLGRRVGEALRDPHARLPRRIYNAFEYALTRALPSTRPQIHLICRRA